MSKSLFKPADDVPPLLLRPIVDGDVLFRLNRVKIRHRIFPRRLSLRHARVPGHRARVKFLHRRRRVQIPASNLTIRLVRFPETHVQARQRFPHFSSAKHPANSALQFCNKQSPVRFAVFSIPFPVLAYATDVDGVVIIIIIGSPPSDKVNAASAPTDAFFILVSIPTLADEFSSDVFFSSSESSLDDDDDDDDENFFLLLLVVFLLLADDDDDDDVQDFDDE